MINRLSKESGLGQDSIAHSIFSQFFTWMALDEMLKKLSEKGNHRMNRNIF